MPTVEHSTRFDSPLGQQRIRCAIVLHAVGRQDPKISCLRDQVRQEAGLAESGLALDHQNRRHAALGAIEHRGEQARIDAVPFQHSEPLASIAWCARRAYRTSRTYSPYQLSVAPHHVRQTGDGTRDGRGPPPAKGPIDVSKNAKIALIIVGLGLIVALLVFLRREKTLVDAATAKIEETIDELDPAAKAAVVARLGIEVKDKAIEAKDIAVGTAKGLAG